MTANTTGLSRDFIIPPCKTIGDVLTERGISLDAFAHSMGKSLEFASEVVSGKKPVTAEVARCLERALGVNKALWINLQANYEAELKVYEPKVLSILRSFIK